MPFMLALAILAMLPMPEQPVEQVEVEVSDMFNASLTLMVSLHVADLVCTSMALDTGRAYEANPLLRPFAGNDYAFAAAKLGITYGSYYLLRKIYSHNKTVGWVMSVALNVALTWAVCSSLKIAGEY